MGYNPNIHHRKSIRLKGYDYSQAGLYFITICVQNRRCLFGKIENDEMMLNDFGKVADEYWRQLAERFTNFELDVFQIMPNHMHGIILLSENVGAGFTPDPNNNDATKNVWTTFTPDPDNNNATKNVGAGFTPDPNNNNATENVETGLTPDHNNNNAINDETAGASPAPTTVGDMVGAYKSLVANECLAQFKLNRPNEIMGKLWQRNYYEHIIRNEVSYQRISTYIINNPKNWKDDKFHSD